MAVHLEADGQLFGFVDGGGSRGVNREIGPHAALVKIHAIENLLAISGRSVGFGTGEFKGQAVPVVGSDSGPKAACELIAKACAHGVALVLRYPEAAGDIAERAGCVVA